MAPAPQQKLLGPWAYFGLQLLFSIPLVGFILLSVFSLDDNNQNRRNFARCYWCSLIVGVALVVITVVLILLLGGTDLIEEIVRSI
jgi:ABC-type Fe3+ transport system permease subunit